MNPPEEKAEAPRGPAVAALARGAWRTLVLRSALLRRWLRRYRFYVRLAAWAVLLALVGTAGYWALEYLHVPLAMARQAPGGSGGDGGLVAAPVAVKPVREKIKITIQTLPPVKAEVRWGKKKLGVINATKKPFFIERFRDSGPLDIVVRAEGFLPVHTRAYSFDNNKVTVKLTPVAEKHTLFGFKQVPDGGADGGAGDAGVPPVVGPLPPPPAPLPMGPAPPPSAPQP